MATSTEVTNDWIFISEINEKKKSFCSNAIIKRSNLIVYNDIL